MRFQYLRTSPRTPCRTLLAHLLPALMLGLTAASIHAAPNDPVVSVEYDAMDNPTKVTDGLGHATTQSYDARHRPVQQNQPHPSSTGQLGTIKTQYNGQDTLTQVTDPRNLATQYTIDGLGNLTQQTSPDTGTTSYTRDAAGNLKTRTDARGRVATYSYDALNRLTRITHANGTVIDETIDYSYDQGTNGTGRLTGMSDLSGTTTWTYNANGQITRKQQRIGNVMYDLQTQYDSAGRLSRMIYPSGRYVDYQYNANGQVQHVWIDSTPMITNITYHATGLIKSYTWGNNQSFTQTIDQNGRPISKSLGGNEQLQITYDNTGRITQTQRALNATPATAITGSTSTYVYDNLDRLTNNITTSTNTGYQYDLSHNRTNLTIGANNYAYDIDPNSNKLNSEAGPTARTYSYDANGSPTANGQDTYTYYNSGRLKQVTRPITTNGVTTPTNVYALRYNGLGEFVHRTNATRHYLYDHGQHLIGEYNGTGDVLQETVYLGDTPIFTLRPDSQNRTADNNGTATTANATRTGTWTAAATIKGYYGANYHTHVSTADAPSPDNILYKITPAATKDYRVYARWIAQATNATNAQYTINPNTAGSTPTTITVDQTRNGGTWNYLGTFSLNTANQLTVTLNAQGNGTVVADAIRIIPNAAGNIQSTTFFVHTDHLNTPRLITNYNNQKRWSWYHESAEPFGANLPNENPATPALGVFSYNLRFPGQLYDPTSNLSYNYFRDYNSRTGRYIESDPIGLAGGINTYAYVGGNPLSYSDPLGLTPRGAAIGAGIGGVLGGIAGAILGGTGGTLALPGVGTISIGAAGAGQGAIDGAALGGALGDTLSNAIAGNDSSLASSRGSSTSASGSSSSCEECSPPVGTRCYEGPDTSHSHAGINPHYHIFQMFKFGGKCQWKYLGGKVGKGVLDTPPSGMAACSTYPGFQGR